MLLIEKILGVLKRLLPEWQAVKLTFFAPWCCLLFQLQLMLHT